MLEVAGSNPAGPITASKRLTNFQSFLDAAKKMQALKAADIADAILFAVQAPEHMNVNEVLIRPTTQER